MCELIFSVHFLTMAQNAAHTHANQWFERTLDDSAIRRVILPEGFLAADVILNTLINIADGLHVS
jgi:adenylosuccinate lyase